MDEFVARSICRLCGAYCPIEVTIDNGIATQVVGDRTAPLYGGYTCPKGRALPQIHADPSRLTHSLKRQPDGSFRPIGSAQALTEIADKLGAIIEKHGPRSVAYYLGNSVALYPATPTLARSLLDAIGSPMFFSTVGIDQPGIITARALHGDWQGGRTALGQADVALLVGANPPLSKQYLGPNPGRQLKDNLDRGMRLVVIDPRVTETARRAHVHLQLRPGEDATVLAGIIHLLIANGFVDEGFICKNADGLGALRGAVAHYDPAYVAMRAGVDPGALIEAVDIIGNAERGYVAGGTGCSMGGRSTLNAYLLLCIQSLRGYWARQGDPFLGSMVLHPRKRAKAQATGPYPVTGFGEKLRLRGLQATTAGMPTAGLAEEMLLEGPGQVKALFTSGNPMSAWPDQNLTKRALESLELLVTPNVEMSETARLSHYVIATKMTFETPATTQFIEGVYLGHPGYGWEEPYANYTPALIDPPAGADLIEDWQLFYRVGKLLGLNLEIAGRTQGANDKRVALDMESEPSTDEIYETISHGSAVPLSDIKRYPGGHIFEGAREWVGPKDDASEARLDIANAAMMAELDSVRSEEISALHDGARDYPLLLICRRSNKTNNSMYKNIPGIAAQPANPVFMNPDDLTNHGLVNGDKISIKSRYGEIFNIVRSDATLRQGVISMSHGYGVNPGELEDVSLFGANINRLTSTNDDYEQLTGMPRLSAIAVSVSIVS